MRSPRVRFTIRRGMFAVAWCALGLHLWREGGSTGLAGALGPAYSFATIFLVMLALCGLFHPRVPPAPRRAKSGGASRGTGR